MTGAKTVDGERLVPKWESARKGFMKKARLRAIRRQGKRVAKKALVEN